MSHNTFGHLFRVTTWGESHGPAIGCVVDGCPPGIPLTTEDIQVFLDKRRPGQSRFTTQRREPDTVRILSGVFADEAGRQVTTGTPISLHHRQRRSARARTTTTSRTSSARATPISPTGRSTASATIAAAAARAPARRPCGWRPALSPARCSPGVTIRGALVQIGAHQIDRARWSWDEVDNNPFFSPDPGIVETWSNYLDGVRKAGSSVGAADRGRGRRRAGRLGRAHLRQARPGPGRRR